MNSLLNYSYDELCDLLKKYNQPKFRANQLYEGLYLGKSLSEITTIPNDLKQNLLNDYYDQTIKIHTKLISKKDGTIKYVFQYPDGDIVESVFMSYKYGNTLCVSTQVGCRMGCKFCASTLKGLKRNLTAGEILAQVLLANKDNGGNLKNRAVTNVVLMGSGEPLDNYENVVKFLKLLSYEKGINISLRNVSLSICGLADKIKLLAEENLQITLTISLHAPTDDLRKEIMPIANRYSLNELFSAIKFYQNKTKRRVVFEYSLISGKNDTFECAEKLAELTKGLMCHINLIPLNDVKERNLTGTPRKRAYAFMDKLNSLGVSATVRRTLGEDINGACGQLRNQIISEEQPN